MKAAHHAVVICATMLAASLAASASAEILYDATQLHSSGGIYANSYYSDAPTYSNLIVDDITVPDGGWTVDTVSVYDGLLLGGSLTTSQAYLVLFPASLGPVNPMDYATLVTVTQTPEVFTDPNAIPPTRTTQRFDASGLNLTLPPGDYWIGVTPIITGSNPFGAYSSYATHGANAMQYSVQHGEWYTLGGYWGPDMMMKIQGVVPEPATLGLVLLTLTLRRNRR